MVKISISDDEVERIRSGDEVKVESKEFDDPVYLGLDTSDGLDVNVVDNVESDGDTDQNSGSQDSELSRKSAEQLKSELVEIKTQKKKLESELSDIMDKIDYYNDKIRLAKQEGKDDLVEKAESKKSEKMERVEEINETISDLKEREHKVRERMNN